MENKPRTYKPRQLRDPVSNWLSKVDKSGECWLWTGACDRHGYGKFQVGFGGRAQKHYRAHRFGYEALVGPIPEGKVVCHSCDNPPCVNPAHLWLGTMKDNTQDMYRKGRHTPAWGHSLNLSRQTHCKRGHEFTEANTHVDSKGGRCCRACRAIRYRLARARGPLAEVSDG